MTPPPTRRFGPGDGPEPPRWDPRRGGPPRVNPPPAGPPPAGPPGWHVPPQAPRPPAGGPDTRRPSRPGRTRSRLQPPGVGAVLAAVVLAGIAAVVLFPEVLGLDQRTPFVQVVAFRPQLAAGLTVVAALGVLGGWTRRAGGTGGLVVALALALVGVVGLGDVAARGVGSSAEVTTGGDGLVVLAVNTYNGAADADDLADVVRARNPDLISLPEARGDLRRRLASRLDDSQGGTGYRAYSADNPSDASGMTVFVRSSLGRPDVTVDREGKFPSIIVDLPSSAPGLASGLRFVAAHPQSPKPGDTSQWRRDVTDLSRWCDDGRPTIVAGDMNATLDHQLFATSTAGCTDAGEASGDGLVGTWPSWAPAILGAQIDHVLTSGGPRPTALEVVPVAGTDHRGVLARIEPG